MEHLDINTLLDGLEGNLSAEESRAMQSHLANCEACAAKFSEYAGLLDALKRAPLEAAPEAALKKAANIFQATRDNESPSIVSVIREFLHDSWATGAAAGLRGGAQTARQVGMTTEDYDLHLSIDYQSATLQGQLLPKQDAEFTPAFSARLLGTGAAELDSSNSNQFGEFTLAKISSGSIIAIELENGSLLHFAVPEGNEK
ncbi:MAG: anti-sigma factor family protein [Pseudomonadales bacterium]|jgi:hypothetical protein